MEIKRIEEFGMTRILLDADETRLLNAFMQNYPGDPSDETPEHVKFRRELFEGTRTSPTQKFPEVDPDDIPF